MARRRRDLIFLSLIFFMFQGHALAKGLRIVNDNQRYAQEVTFIESLDQSLFDSATCKNSSTSKEADQLITITKEEVSALVSVEFYSSVWTKLVASAFTDHDSMSQNESTYKAANVIFKQKQSLLSSILKAVQLGPEAIKQFRSTLSTKDYQIANFPLLTAEKLFNGPSAFTYTPFKRIFSCGIRFGEIASLHFYNRMGYFFIGKENLLPFYFKKPLALLRKNVLSVLSKLNTFNGVSYIGTYLPKDQIEEVLRTKSLDYDAFVSGSSGGQYEMFVKNVVIKVVKNKTGRRIEPISDSTGENEVLWYKPKFKILNAVKDDSYNNYIWLDVEEI